MFERFSDAGRGVVALAGEEARGLDHHYLGTEHVLLGLLRGGESVAARALGGLGISADAVRRAVEAEIGRGKERPTGHIPFTPRAKKVLELSERECRLLGHTLIGPEHLLLALVREGEGFGARTLVGLGVELVRVRPRVMALLAGSDVPLAPEPTLLEQFARNLSQEAAAPGAARVVGRQHEVRRIVQVLSRREQNVPLLVGAPGVGKSSVALGLARAFASGDVPGGLAGLTVRVLDVGALFTDPQHHGRFGELMSGILDEVQRADRLVLVLDNAFAVLRTQGGRAPALAFFRPVLGRPGVRIIAACTTAEYRQRDPDAGLDRLLQTLTVDEPATEEVIEILRQVAPRLAEHHDVLIPDEVAAQAALLARELLPDLALPGSAIALLDEAGVLARLRDADRREVTVSDLADALAVRTPTAPPVERPRLAPPTPHDPSVWAMS
ncbi:Clp protease N-terminal domain-containing protein [Kitasatospora hibisci]|uniref:Clp protease N-terminal domain-containing protein n=1 Tax=Kitasatospora hibisci TaxID=3369522 RepID=UPI003755382A